MAKEREQDLLTYPEQRVARLVSERLRLKTPVNLEKLAKQFATVERDKLPRDADAVVVYRTGSKPHIILNEEKPATRRRFTLAHEIAHVMIPWHLGTVACHTEWTVQFDDMDYAQTEAEANRFASELLMPRAWLRRRVRENKNLRSAFDAVFKAAGVSAQAVSMGLIQVLPPGYVFAALDDDETVLVFGYSQGTLANRPKPGEKLCPDDYDRLASRKTKIKGVHWWFFDPSASIPAPRDHRSASLILSDLLKSLNIRGNRAEKHTQTINGIIGAANSAIRPCSQDELFSGLRQRFLSRPELRRVCSHGDFDAFLAQRALEIVGRRDDGSSAN